MKKIMMLFIVFFFTALHARPENKNFINAYVCGLLQTKNFQADNAVISGNLLVGGSILGSGLSNVIVNSSGSSAAGAVAVFTDASSNSIAASPASVDSSGNITVNGITNISGNTLTWPTSSGSPGQVLTVGTSGNNLVFSTPAGAGNVSTVLPFDPGPNNAVVVTDTPSGVDNVKTSTIIIDGSGNISNVNTLNATTVTAATINGTLNGNASSSTNAANADIAENFSGELSGDVSGPQGATVVNSVGGQSSTNINTGVGAANQATETNTGGCIVKRDSGGNFVCSTITATGGFYGNVNGNLIGTVSNALSANTAINFSGSLSGDVVGTQTTTMIQTVSGQTAFAVAAAAKLCNSANSATGSGTLVLRDGSGSFTSSTITATTGFIGNLNGNVLGNVTGNLTGTASFAINATTATTAINFSGPLFGDCIGTQTATQVAYVGGVTAEEIFLTYSTVASASSNNQQGELVIRDGSGNFITNMITIDGTPVNPTDVATKSYVDSAVATGFKVLQPVFVVSVVDIGSPPAGLQIIDGVTLIAGERVLLTGQSNEIYNGIWLAQSGAWTYPSDFQVGQEAGSAYVLTTSGVSLSGTGWVCTTPTSMIGTNTLQFAQFSTQGSITAANVGTGAGTIFRDKTGIDINLKTISAGSHIVVTNNQNDVNIGTDATSTQNIFGTLIARDGSGNFTANSMNGALTGAASLNVLKTGDTMTGNLNLANQSSINFQDTVGNSVSVSAPANVNTQYGITLPAAPPTAGQVLLAVTPATTAWTTLGGAPSVAKIFYVGKNGNDGNDGSFSAPFLTIAQALTAANQVASLSNPIVISVGAGTFIENNSGGALPVQRDGITIIGSSISGTTVTPQALNINLFNIATPNVEISNITFSVAANSTASAVNLATTGVVGTARFTLVGVSGFQTGFALSSDGSATALLEMVQITNNGTGINATDIQVFIQNTLVNGSTSSIGNTGISLTGNTSQVLVSNSVIKNCTTGITTTGGVRLRLLSNDFENSFNDIVCNGNSTTSMVGCNFILGVAGSTDITALSSGTKLTAEGCHFDGSDSSGTAQGTAAQVSGGATLYIDSCIIENMIAGLSCGASGDTASTIMNATGVTIINCATHVAQGGSATLAFLSGVFDDARVTVNDSTNVSFAAFDDDANLAFGANQDVAGVLYEVFNGQPVLQNLVYTPNYYGNKGTVYVNANTNPTFNGVQSNAADANYYAITGNRNNNAAINLISDTNIGSSVGSGTNVRGWQIAKTGASAGLGFNYSNNDTSGQAAIGSYTAMNLNGVNNQVEFPTVTGSNPPTNSTAKLVWAGDTDLYRVSSGVLQTDGNLIVNGLTPNCAVATNSSNQLVSSTTTTTQLGFLAGVTSSVQTQLNSKVSKAGDTMTGTLTLPNGTTSLPSLTFNGSPTTGISAVNDNISLCTAGSESMKIGVSGTITIDGLTPAGIVHNDISGNLSTSLIVNADVDPNAQIQDSKLATIASPGKIANSATSAISGLGASTIVLRDPSNNFTANIITATLNGNAATATSCITSVTATYFSNPLVGDVIGTQGATQVAYVGGELAADVALATIAANAATPTATINTIVMRDPTASITCNMITATGGFYGTLNGNVNGTAANATNATTATYFSGSLSGDVIGTQTTTMVQTVSGQTAFAVSQATQLTNAATFINTGSTIVRRDGSGNFAAGTITANGFVGPLTGNVVGNLTGNASSATFALTATTALNFSGQLLGDVIGTQSATQVARVGTASAASVAAAVSTISTATSNNVAGTLVLRDGSSNFATNMITINGTTTNPTDAATKSYVDGAVSTGFTVHPSVLAYGSTNITLSGLQTIDGVSLVANNRVLLNGQTNQVQNGIWLVQAGSWTRPTDFPTPPSTTAGSAYVLVTSGTNFAGTSWVCSTPTAVVGTNNILFSQFSTQGSVTGANIGSGAGQVYAGQTGSTLNFKTVLAGSHITVTNDASDVAIGTDGASTLAPNTLVARDGSNNFAAGTITAALTGAASLNVLKAGDTMTGNLNLANQSALNFQDSTTGRFVSLNAPTTIGSSYAVSLPTSAPAIGQFLQASSPTTLQWTTAGGSPAASLSIYVAVNGSDSNNGSQNAPFASIAAAVALANTISTLTNPVVIRVGAGLFTENNSGGAINITADGISIVGASNTGTIIVPLSLSNTLFNCTTSNVLFRTLTIDAGASSGSTAAGVVIAAGAGQGGLQSCIVSRFQTGVSCSSLGTVPDIVLFSVLLQGNATGVVISNTRVTINSCIFLGALTGTIPLNTGITVTGSNALVTMLANSLRLLSTGISATGSSNIRLLGTNIETSTNSLVATGGCNCAVVGCNFIFNNSSSINVNASGASTAVTLDGCQFQCHDASNNPQGIAIQVTGQASVLADSCAIEQPVTGIVCGTAGDSNTTSIQASGVTIVGGTTDVIQSGSSTMSFIAGSFDQTKISIANPTYVTFAAFDAQADLVIGTNNDIQDNVYRVLNGQATLPTLTYSPNYYGNKGTVYINTNGNPTCNGTQSTLDANYYVVTGNRGNQAAINLISDTSGSVGTGANVRGWQITKTPTAAGLSFNYSNNDQTPVVGLYTVMNLNGVNNQVEFPLTTTTNPPTNSIAKLVWAGDTDLYRASAGLLQTDGNLVIAGLTPNKALTCLSNGQLSSSVTTTVELGYLSGTTSSVQTQLSGKVAKAGDIMTGSLTLPAGSVAVPSLQFSGSTNTGICAPAANTLSLCTSGSECLKIGATGTVTIDALNVAGVLHNDAFGNLSTSLIVDADVSTSAAIQDIKLAQISSIGKVANSATTATNLNLANQIVARDSLGNFLANVITGTLNGNASTATSALSAITSVTSTYFTNALSGDVSGTQGSTTVVRVGNQTAAQVATGVVAALNATNTATPSTIVLRDSAGSFVSNIITATGGFLGNLSGNLTGTASFATSATNAVNFSGPLSGDILGFQLTTSVNTVGGQSAPNIASATLLANGATYLSTSSAIVRRDGSGNFAAGTVTANLIGTVTGHASLDLPLTGGTLTGNLTLPAGATATPSLNFSGSLTSGLCAAVANTLSICANGVEHMTLTGTQVNFKVPLVCTGIQALSGIQAVAPTLGQTITVNAGVSNLLLLPSGIISAFTVVFPPSPIDGQLFTIVLGTGNAITFTSTAGTGLATIVNALTGLSVTLGGTSVTYIYKASTNSWYRC